MKRETITILYGTFVSLMVLVLGLAYANVTTELKIEGNTVGQEQEGVYITNVEYLTNNGADTTNSGVNYFLGTMLDSKVVLGSSSSSSLTYKVTIKNNTEREQVFIGIIKDETNEEAYNNTSIQPNVETAGGITGLEQYVTTIAPEEYITFPVTYAYAGTDTSNPELQGKINFRFREKPILELSNNGETYTLENIYAGYTPAEYEFTVSNYNENYTNGVPLTYTFETELTEGSPLTAIIYDSEGNEVTENITMPGDSTNADHTYTLKLTWDSSLDSEEYEGKSYACRVNLVAIPDVTVDADLADYGDYSIEQGFEVDITTCKHEFEKSAQAGTKFTTTGDYSDGTNTAVIPEGFTVSGAGGTCTICGVEAHSQEFEINEGLVIYLIDDMTETEIANIAWDNKDELLNLKKTYDQFVWVPIPKENINEMYMCQSEDGTKSCKITVQEINGENKAYCTTHSSTAMAGRLYATGMGESYDPTLTTQTYVEDQEIREPDVVDGGLGGLKYDGITTNLEQLNGILGTSYSTANDFKTDLQSEYNETVKSVYENEGFYIGRYETSGMKNTDTNATVKIVIGSDNSTNANISNVNWYRMYAQQKKYASNKGLTGSIGSSMIQGAAYDQVMKFIDPTTSFVKTTGRVSHDLSVLYQTGGLNYAGSITYNDVAKNIYDLEGNLRTWTTEVFGATVRTYRGGSYSSKYSPSYRTNYYPDDGTRSHVGSICQLYVHTSHTYSNWVVTKEAICADTGTKIGTCGCGATTTETIPATGNHTFGEWVVTKAATCAATGTKTRTCTICGATESETIAKLTTHSYGNWTTVTEATCNTAGSQARTCSVCGASQTSSIAATGNHTYSDWSCTHVLSTNTYLFSPECSVCNGNLVASIVDGPTNKGQCWGCLYAKYEYTFQNTTTDASQSIWVLSICGQCEAYEILEGPALVGYGGYCETTQY